jgi:hypothetical protein
MRRKSGCDLPAAYGGAAGAGVGQSPELGQVMPTWAVASHWLPVLDLRSPSWTSVLRRKRETLDQHR